MNYVETLLWDDDWRYWWWWWWRYRNDKLIVMTMNTWVWLLFTCMH